MKRSDGSNCIALFIQYFSFKCSFKWMCVVTGVKTNEFVFYVRLSVFAEKELQLGFMYS